jgi:hypothetical protein
MHPAELLTFTGGRLSGPALYPPKVQLHMGMGIPMRNLPARLGLENRETELFLQFA